MVMVSTLFKLSILNNNNTRPTPRATSHTVVVHRTYDIILSLVERPTRTTHVINYVNKVKCGAAIIYIYMTKTRNSE